jgi:type III secretion protein V
MKRISDLFMAALVIAITAMLLVPLPTYAIDFLIVLNLAIAFLLLIAGLYMPNSLSMLSFPTLILLTTLFRLALNVASSRLILSQADAGVVIHAFGTFLVRGEIFVGLVIFSIVTIVNFIVIAKGASRVSEVSARFVLDALPGKQSSIDSDLRSGLITPEQAKDKREELRKESQLFGAMDGSMKFIQGDAIAGLLIIVTNIIGGLYMGLSRGMDLSEAARIYTILTVGDGLVTQVPALLISICAGIVVTRVTSADGVTIGSDIAHQLLSNERTIILTGTVLSLIGLFPNVPKLPFLAVGIGLIVTGIILKRKKLSIPVGADITEEANPKMLLGYSGASQHAIDKRNDSFLEPVQLICGAEVFKLVSVDQQRILHWWQQYRTYFVTKLGLPLPALNFVSSASAAPMSIECHYSDRMISKGIFKLDSALVCMPPIQGRALGFHVIDNQEHPLWKTLCFWSGISSEHKRLVAQLDVDSLDSSRVILLQAISHFLNHPEDIITSSYTYTLLQEIEKDKPGFISEGLGRYFLPVTKISQVLAGLVREQVSIRDISKIAQLVSEFCSINRITLQDDADVSSQSVIEFIRVKLRKSIRTIVDPDNDLVITVNTASSVEEVFERINYNDETSSIDILPSDLIFLKKSFTEATKHIHDKGLDRLIVLTDTTIRHKISAFLRLIGRSALVLSEKEIEPDMKLEKGILWSI